MRDGSFVDQRTVFVVGDSIFAAGIAQTLTDSGAARVVGTASSIGAALPRLRDNGLDALIVAGATDTMADCGAVLIAYPGLTIIRADPDVDKVQVISSRCVQARFSDLLAVIEALRQPK
jgi:hypothetical protein